MSKFSSQPRLAAVTAVKSSNVAGHVLCGLLVVMTCLLASSRVLYAQDAAIEDVVVANSTTDLLLYCSVGHSFTAEMVEGLHNGIPVTFTFFVDLDEERTFFPDREVVSLSFDHTLSYDTLKEQYRVTFPAEAGKSVSTLSFDEAKRLMTEVNGFKVTSLINLTPDGEYTISIKARLAKKTLPLNFHYIVPFWHLWDFETDWRTVQFRY